jgi:hypothetical protein
MSHFIEYYLLLLLIPTLLTEVIPQDFYKVKSRYPLFLSLQMAIMTLITHLSFQYDFPITSIIPVYDLFEIRLVLDTGSSLFLIGFSVSVFIILLRLNSEERKKLTFLIMAVLLIALSGNTITFFLGSIVYLIILQFDVKDKLFGHLIDSIPFVLLISALSLVLLTGQIQGNQNILNTMDFLTNRGIILFLIMSAFFLPVLLSISDILFHSSGKYADIKLLMTMSTLIYILCRFTEPLSGIDEVLNYSFTLLISMIALSITAIIFCQRKDRTSLIPLMFLYFLFLSFLFIRNGLSGHVPVVQNYIYGFPIYLAFIIMTEDILSVVKDDISRFALIAAVFILVFFNPWTNSAFVFNSVFYSVLNKGIVFVILFIIISLLAILISTLSVLITKFDESKKSSLTEKSVLFMGVIILLFLFERFF